MKKVLLISTNALGDTYLTCAAFNSIKNHFEKVSIDIVSTESAKFILSEVGFDHLFLLKKKSFSEMHNMITQVRKTKYDFVFNFFPGQMNSSIFKLSNAVEKIGFTNFIRKKSWHNDDDALIIKSQPKEKRVWHPSDNYLHRISMSLKAAGIDGEVKKHVFNFDNIKENKYDVALHLFSFDENRKISNDSILEIVKELCVKQNQNVFLFGSEKEIIGLKELKNIKNLKLEVSPDIKKLVNNIKKSKLFVGVDSFPLHIADAHNIKTLGIFYYPNENSVFQNMENKYIFRVNDNKVNSGELVNFIKEKKLIDGI
ncbi:MAG: glycosyltransferase family 9 protein [Bacteroidetes bacterium]|nr:glycosyltransferase family 9 protein [Bacteroidota bacterium]